MTSMSDTLTVGLILVLLFGSIALYLYTRIQQAEQKLNLLESILLDLKMSSEIKSYSELPAENIKEYSMENTEHNINYIPFTDVDDFDKDKLDKNSELLIDELHTKSENKEEISEYKSVINNAVNDENSSSKMEVNYEAMTIKELQTLAKTRGITGAGSMKKGSIIEALKTSDRSTTNIESGSLNMNGTSSFLDTSSSFQSNTESQ